MPANNINNGFFDIRIYKKELREEYKAKRSSFSVAEKQVKDNAIIRKLLELDEYKKASKILTFVSMNDEINTQIFIKQCFKDKKIVAVPYCIDGTREMNFYKIESLDELVPRTFGVLEPANPTQESKVADYHNSICIIPGLVFDKDGYRIGYGGGYYDRFLSEKFNGVAKLGVCYSECLINNIISGRFDVPCDYVVTQDELIDCK